jgi:putative glutamine amidotransferase
MREALELERVPVNSMHHQGIKSLAPALVASAVAPDGLVEAAESATDHFLVGVQWHPEVFEPTDPHTKALFHEFVRQAGTYSAERRAPSAEGA